MKNDEFFQEFQDVTTKLTWRVKNFYNFTCFQREEAVQGARDLQQQVEGQEEEVPGRAGLHGETGPDVPE